jgi:hypothetical protein
MLGIGDTIRLESGMKGVIFMDENMYIPKKEIGSFLVYSKDFGDHNIKIMGKAKDPKDNIDWLYIRKDNSGRNKAFNSKMVLIEKKWKNFEWIEEDYIKYKKD